MILHVEEEFLGGQFRCHAVTTFIEVTPVVSLVLISNAPVLVLYPRPHTERTHFRGRLSIEAVVASDVLIEGSCGFEVVHITVCVTTLVGELLLPVLTDGAKGSSVRGRADAAVLEHDVSHPDPTLGGAPPGLPPGARREAGPRVLYKVAFCSHLSPSGKNIHPQDQL